MIKSEVFCISCAKGLTKDVIEDFFRERNINPVKWAIVGYLDDKIKILVSF